MRQRMQASLRRPAGAPARCFPAGLYVLLVGLLLACAPVERGDVDAHALDVMTFNIRYGTAEDGGDAWPLRRELLLDVIRAHKPHVLGVQEALRFQLDDVQRPFTDYGEVGVGRDDGGEAGEYSAILYDTSRLEVLEQGTFWFSATPQVPGSVSWGNRITRIATWARFRDLASGAAFYVYNMHWDHESQASRDSSAVLVLHHLAERPVADPVIVMGDFNAGETNSAFRALLAGDSLVAAAPRLLDTFRAIHPSATDVGTFHEFIGGVEGEKIDGVLVSHDWRVLDASIVRTARDGRYPSDHYPVTARVILR